MIFKKCAELPLSIFIKIVLGGDVSLLIISGEHTKEEAAAAWADVYSEYFELCGSADCRHIIQTAKSILIAENKITIINACTTILRVHHNDKLYTYLEKIGFPLKRIDDPIEREAAIERLLSRAKTLVHVAQTGGKELERMTQGGPGPSENDYIETLAHLSKFQGYRIDPEKTTVSEFLAIQKHYLKLMDYGKGKYRRDSKQGGVKTD